MVMVAVTVLQSTSYWADIFLIPRYSWCMIGIDGVVLYQRCVLVYDRHEDTIYYDTRLDIII